MSSLMNCNFSLGPFQQLGTTPSYSPAQTQSSDDIGSCAKGQFQCRPGECVFAKYVCDGEVIIEFFPV